MRMDWIEDVIALFECRTLHEAAERRFLTQPAFSRRIQAIEEGLGITLLDRSSKPAVPHPALRLHEERLRELANDMKALVRDLQRYGQQQSDFIAFAVQHSISSAIAPGVVKTLMERLPLGVRMLAAHRSKCFAMLITKQAQITITHRARYEAPPREPYMEDLVIGHERLIPVLSPEVSGEVTAMIASRKLPLVTYPQDVFLGRLFNHEVTPEVNRITSGFVTIEIALPQAAMSFAAAGAGIAWIPESLAAAEIAVGRLADLSDALPSPQLTIAANRLIGPKRRIEDDVWDMLGALAQSAGDEAGGDGRRGRAVLWKGKTL